MKRTHEEVGQLVKERRLHLHMSPPELARAAHVDPKTVRALESGERWPQDASRAKIETALKWEIGTLDGLLAGRFAKEAKLAKSAEPKGLESEWPPVAPIGGRNAWTEDQFDSIFGRWIKLYAASFELEWQYARARGIDVAEARDELIMTMVMAGQAKDGRPWTPPWEEYPDGFEPWDDRWWSTPGNRERFQYWMHGAVGLHSEYRKDHPEYLGWPTKVSPVDLDDPERWDLAAHPKFETERERHERLHGDRGEENQDNE